MVIIHAVKKLLNTSRIQAALYVSQGDSGQHLHSWYARLLPSGFAGKLFVLYVHEPSLTVVVCRGKTIQGSWDNFQSRLKALLTRFRFPAGFIEHEFKYMDGYVVSRTSSRSVLSHMNQMIFQLEYDCTRFVDYDSISQEYLEDRMMENLYQYGPKKSEYRTPLDFWQETIGLQPMG